MARIRYLLEKGPEQEDFARLLIAETQLYLEKIESIDADRMSENWDTAAT